MSVCCLDLVKCSTLGYPISQSHCTWPHEDLPTLLTCVDPPSSATAILCETPLSSRSVVWVNLCATTFYLRASALRYFRARSRTLNSQVLFHSAVDYAVIVIPRVVILRLRLLQFYLSPCFCLECSCTSGETQSQSSCN